MTGDNSKPISEAGQLGISLLAPATRKLIEAANIYAATQDKKAAFDLYLGVVSQVAGVMAQHIGCVAAADILKYCVTAIDQKHKRSLN